MQRYEQILPSFGRREIRCCAQFALSKMPIWWKVSLRINRTTCTYSMLRSNDVGKMLLPSVAPSRCCSCCWWVQTEPRGLEKAPQTLLSPLIFPFPFNSPLPHSPLSSFPPRSLLPPSFPSLVRPRFLWPPSLVPSSPSPSHTFQPSRPARGSHPHYRPRLCNFERRPAPIRAIQNLSKNCRGARGEGKPGEAGGRR